MNILHVTSYYEPAYGFGGDVRAVSDMCKTLATLGCDVSVFATDAAPQGRLQVAPLRPQNRSGVMVTYYPLKWRGWARGRAFATLVACLFVHMRSKGYRWPKARWVAPVLLFIIPALVLQQDRAFFGRWLAGEGRLVPDAVRLLGQAHWQGNLRWHERVAVVASVVPERSGYSYGSQYLWAFLWPIPRVLWRKKPVQTSIVDLAKYCNVRGMAIPAVADAYMTFGWISLFFQMLLAGSACGFLHEVHKINIENDWIAVPYLLFLSNLRPFLNGGLLGGLPAILFSVLPPLVVGYLSRRQRVSASSEVRERGARMWGA